MNKKIATWKFGLLFLAFVVPFVLFFSRPVMTQEQIYHGFVDHRSMFGIPNALDVLTNILFLFVGYLGITEILKQKNLVTRKPWLWLFISILFVGPGSAYYHWEPNDQTLIWDRLPMSVAFAAVYIILLSEHVSVKLEKFLWPALMTGILSVVVWVITGDLRFYFWIQFSIFVTTPIVLLLFPSRFTHKYYYFICLLFYALAKITEVKDKEIFEATGHLMSGHSMKHILAAIGLMFLWWMLKTRREEPAS